MTSELWQTARAAAMEHPVLAVIALSVSLAIFLPPLALATFLTSPVLFPVAFFLLVQSATALTLLELRLLTQKSPHRCARCTYEGIPKSDLLHERKEHSSTKSRIHRHSRSKHQMLQAKVQVNSCLTMAVDAWSQHVASLSLSVEQHAYADVVAAESSTAKQWQDPLQKTAAFGQLEKLMEERIIFIDGAMGTSIQKHK